MKKEIFNIIEMTRSGGSIEKSPRIIKGLLIIAEYLKRTKGNSLDTKVNKLGYISYPEILEIINEIELETNELKGVLRKYCFSDIESIDEKVLSLLIKFVLSNEEDLGNINNILNEYQAKGLAGTIYSSSSINYLLPRLIDVKN
ncbi:MAG: hypothetical protein ACRDA5_03410, partial [Clostridium sp.]